MKITRDVEAATSRPLWLKPLALWAFDASSIQTRVSRSSILFAAETQQRIKRRRYCIKIVENYAELQRPDFCDKLHRWFDSHPTLEHTRHVRCTSPKLYMDSNAVFVQMEWSYDSRNVAHRNVCIWDTECGYSNCNLSFQAMCSPDHCGHLMAVFRYLEMDFANNLDFGVKRSS